MVTEWIIVPNYFQIGPSISEKNRFKFLRGIILQTEKTITNRTFSWKESLITISEWMSVLCICWTDGRTPDIALSLIWAKSCKECLIVVFKTRYFDKEFIFNINDRSRLSLAHQI